MNHIEASRHAGTDLATVLDTFNAVHEEENLQMEEFVPDHQPEEEMEVELSDAPSDEEPFVRTEAEKDAEERAANVIAGLPRPAAKAPKRPRSPVPIDDDVPDLAEIFDNYDTPKATRISICRAYASYLAACAPKKPKAAPKKRSK